jgi:hypothetical protein
VKRPAGLAQGQPHGPHAVRPWHCKERPVSVDKKILDRLRPAKQHEEEQQQADECVREDAAEKARSEGRAAGRTWAEEKATPSQLQAIAACDANPSRAPLETVLWQHGAGDIAKSRSQSYMKGFVEGAASLWEEVKDQL